MRIGIVTHMWSPFGRQCARLFADRGHTVEIFSITPVKQEVAGVGARALSRRDFDPRFSKSRWPFLKMILPLRRAAEAFDADVIYGMAMSSGGLLASLSGGRCIAVCAMGTDVMRGVRRPLWRRILRYECRNASLVHAVGSALADLLREHCGLPEKKIYIAPIGVDTGMLAFVDPAGRPNRGHILNTRAHLPRYGQATFVKALSRLRDRGVEATATFTHTRGVERTQTLVHAHNLDDRVTFLPGYEYEELPALLAGADVYVSATEQDGTSQSLLEAMSTGTFPVVSNIPANRPWVEHGTNGLLFPMGDDAALADCLEEALSRPDLRARAAPISRRTVEERGDMGREADRLLQAFEKACAGDPAPDRKGLP